MLHSVFSQVISEVWTCWFVQESHSAKKNDHACQTSWSFFHHGQQSSLLMTRKTLAVSTSPTRSKRRIYSILLEWLHQRLRKTCICVQLLVSQFPGTLLPSWTGFGAVPYVFYICLREMPSHVPNLEAYTKVFIRPACAPFIPVQSLEQLKGQQQLSFRFHQKARSTSTYSFQVKTRIPRGWSMSTLACLLHAPATWKQNDKIQNQKDFEFQEFSLAIRP
jgi:hypothetical protein